MTTTREPRGHARTVHLVVAGITLAALVLQLCLTVSGAATLLPEARPSLATRLVQFLSYFTILSNILVLYSEGSLARDPERDGPAWRVLRLNALTCITITAMVHWFLLRPLLDLQGASYLADKLLHVVVPLLMLVAWLVAGPRGKVTRLELAPSLILPAAWLAWTLLAGAVRSWYPYPFVDVDLHGYAVVALNCAGVALLLLALSALALWADGRLTARADARAVRAG